MAILTAAVTALTLAGTPGLAVHRDTSAGVHTPGEITRLSVGATPGQRYGAFFKGGTAPGAHSGTFTRLVPSATPSQQYGSFAGKFAQTDFEKIGLPMSIVPVVTMGPVTDVDIDITMNIVPVLAMSSNVRQALTANASVVPRLVMARGSTLVSGTFPKAATASIVPQVSLTVTTNKSLPISMSVVPVLTSSASVDGGSDNLEASASVIPVLTMAASANITSNSITASASIVPVLSLTIGINRINAALNHDIVMTVAPILNMSSSVRTAGEVDHIHITGNPYGYIRITKV
jgi:hypothetical protein